MDRREVDHVIVGAGVAGMALQAMLPKGSAVLLDADPFAYKGGEAIVGRHFAHPLMRSLADVAARLPSATPREGTIFVSDDSIGWYPQGDEVAPALHVDRHELERATAEHLGTQVTRATVRAVDVDQGTVETDVGTWVARRLIVDCSGSACVVARALGIAREVWPTWTAWAYHDVVDASRERFREHLAARPVSLLYENHAHRLIAAGTKDAFDPTRATVLTRVADGTWSWQVPLRGGRRLAVGVLSRHGPVGEDEYALVAARTIAPHFVTRTRATSGTDPHDRFHVANRFAWASERFAGERWALVGDAAFFGDPLFGTGTAVATNQALHLGALLVAGDWSSGQAEAFHARTALLWQRARRSYSHWASGRAMSTDDEVMLDVERDYLPGHLFQVQSATAFAAMRDVAAPSEGRTGPAPGPTSGGRVVTEGVAALLRDAALSGWTLRAARSHGAKLELDWSHADSAPLRVLVTAAVKGERYYSEVQGLGLRYQKAGSVQDSLDDRARALMDGMAGLAHEHGARLRALL